MKSNTKGMKKTNCYYSQGLSLLSIFLKIYDHQPSENDTLIKNVEMHSKMHSMLFPPSRPSHNLFKMGVSFKKGWTFLHLLGALNGPLSLMTARILTKLLALHCCQYKVPTWPAKEDPHFDAQNMEPLWNTVNEPRFALALNFFNIWIDFLGAALTLDT